MLFPSECKYDFEIPEVIKVYARENLCNLQINYNTIINYFLMIRINVVLSLYAEICTRKTCNYHSIFRPDERGEKCNRHNLERKYVDVFHWSNENKETLEKAFADFLDKKYESK